MAGPDVRNPRRPDQPSLRRRRRHMYDSHSKSTYLSASVPPACSSPAPQATPAQSVAASSHNGRTLQLLLYRSRPIAPLPRISSAHPAISRGFPDFATSLTQNSAPLPRRTKMTRVPWCERANLSRPHSTRGKREAGGHARPRPEPRRPLRSTRANRADGIRTSGSAQGGWSLPAQRFETVSPRQCRVRRSSLPSFRRGASQSPARSSAS